MKLNLSWILLAGVAFFTTACDDKGDDTSTSSEADADTDTDTDTDADTDADIENPYTSFEGWESLDYGFTLAAGDYNCQLVWDVSGTPVNPIDADCDNCEFMFDVSYSMQDEPYVFDDGTCAKYGLDTPDGTYGYSSDLDGYGPAWVFDYYGAFYWWGYGDFSGSDFTYWYGISDYPYSYNGSNYYYTFYQYGLVTVQ